MEDSKALKERIRQLEESMRKQKMLIPPSPDPTLAEDEWYAIFPDYRTLIDGRITKIPWQGGSNMTSVFKVKKIY